MKNTTMKKEAMSKEYLYKIIFEVDDEDEFQRRLEEWFKQ